MDLTVAAFIVLFALLFLGVPIGFAMGAVGTVAFAIQVSWTGALNQIGILVTDTVLNYNFSVLPLVVLMGAMFAHARMADELYAASYAFLGHRRGGLAMATILACGGFSAISGSALACAATMTKVSVPFMRRYGYAPGFAAGTVAIGATLDILIPPSIAMVIYAIITEVALGKLMIAGFLPGLLSVVLYLMTIAAVTAIWPKLGPAGQRTPWPRRLRSLGQVWPIVALFAVVLGGIYLGVFTPTEAAGIGAFGAFLLALVRGRLTLPLLTEVLVEAVRTTSMLFIVLIGSLLFANFVTVSGSTAAFESWISAFELGQTGLIVLILAVYVVLGCVLEATAMMLLTVPILFPVILKAGIDPIWFGIFVVIMGGIGLIHPPMGMLLFVVKSMLPDVRTGTVFWGVAPYLVADAVRIGLFIAFPAIVLVLPRLMN